VAGSETLTPEQVYLETILLGFRTRDGVDCGLLENHEGTKEVLRHLQQAGLVHMVGGRVVPTVRAFSWRTAFPSCLQS
jgi:coproporphyrinogen III oxidase-like Fe-S oxidoreductase